MGHQRCNSDSRSPQPWLCSHSSSQPLPTSFSSIKQDLRALVIEACARSVSIWLSEPNSNNFVTSEPYFIKWSDRPHHHAETQKYVYDHASQDSNIPKVYDRFDHGIWYIPMLSPSGCYRLASEDCRATEWLRSLPPPPKDWPSWRWIRPSPAISGLASATAVLL